MIYFNVQTEEKDKICPCFMIFGAGDINIMSGTYLKGGSDEVSHYPPAGALVFKNSNEVKEVGSVIELEDFKKIESQEVIMVFEKTESIDTLIFLLRRAKELMLKEEEVKDEASQ